MDKKTCDFGSSDRTPPGVGGSIPGFIHLSKIFDFLIHLRKNKNLVKNRSFGGTEMRFYTGKTRCECLRKLKKSGRLRRPGKIVYLDASTRDFSKGITHLKLSNSEMFLSPKVTILDLRIIIVRWKELTNCAFDLNLTGSRKTNIDIILK